MVTDFYHRQLVFTTYLFEGLHVYLREKTGKEVKNEKPDGSK
jgi:hypothetical protein